MLSSTARVVTPLACFVAFRCLDRETLALVVHTKQTRWRSQLVRACDPFAAVFGCAVLLLSRLFTALLALGSWALWLGF